VYRFDDDLMDDLEGKVNGWPLGEGYIDYVAGGTTDGDAGAATNIISDTSIDFSSSTLLGALNENGGDTNIATGYHAVEFMLWGQDLNAASTGTWTTPRDNTAGQRPVSDYLGDGACTTGANNAVQASGAVCTRRGAYLKAVAQLLVEDLTVMKEEWDPAGTNNHYDEYVGDTTEGLRRMLSGMGRLSFGELAGERIDIARLDNSQEDEHSCFSDNTHRDIVTNAQGVQNSFLGTLNGTSYGPGLFDLLVAEGQVTLANNLKANLETTSDAANVVDAKAVIGNPFDNQIQATDKTDVEAVITALINQASRDAGGSITDAATALGINLDAEQDTDQDL